MKRLAVFGLVLLTCGADAQVLRFEFVSPPGEFVGLGATRDIEYTINNTAFFDPTIRQFGSSGPDYIELNFMLNPMITDWLRAKVSTRQLGHELRPGIYTNAEQADFASPGRPGLDINFQGRGASSALTGRFEIEDIAYTNLGGNQWGLNRLRMSFEQNVNGSPLTLKGRITYGTVPEPATVLLLGLPTLAMYRRRKLKISGVSNSLGH